MRSWLLSFVLVSTVAFLVLLSPAAAASTVRVGPGADHDHHGSSWMPRCLTLSWLRDTVADWIFNRTERPGGSRAPKWYRAAHAAKYASHTVIRFNVMTADEEAALSAAAERLFLDIWSFNNHTGTVDILIDKEDVASLLTLLPKSLRHSYSPLMPDLAALVRDTYPKMGSSDATVLPSIRGRLTDGIPVADRSGTDNIFFRDYQPYPVIVQWMKLMDVMFPFVHMVSIGESSEGREIFGLRIGTSHHDAPSYNTSVSHGADGENDDDDDETFDFGEADKDVFKTSQKKGRGPKKSKKKKSEPAEPAPSPKPAKKKTILITGGMHAREWISASSVCYIAWAMINGYSSTNMIKKLLENFDIVLLPVVNPDGYEYTWDTDRLWRKTRQATNFRYCRGFDLDHAFGYEWDSQVREEPCSETYGGESAFQAVEAMALSTWALNEVEENDVEFVGYLDLHSYSQQILFPFSYSCAKEPPNLENLEELAAGLAKAVRLSSGETYSVSSACKGIIGYDDVPGPFKAPDSDDGDIRVRIEPGGGSAIDWFFHELKAKYAYQIKLRDTGSYGFLLPSSEIVPTGEEMFSVVKYFGDFLMGNNGIEKSVESESHVSEEGEADTSSGDNVSAAGNRPNLILATDDEHTQSEQSILLRRRKRR